MKKTILFSILFFGMLFSSFSQVVLKSGNLKTLKGEKNIKIEYDYSNIAIPKFNSEKEYVDSKVKDYNEKESGKGEKWKESWINSRKERYQPKFEELFNEKVAKKELVASESANNTKITLIVKTTFIEPGFNVGVWKKPAYVNFEFLFVETANHSKVIAQLFANEVPGSQAMGFDYDAGSRIAESYAKAGKMLGKYVSGEL